MTGAAKACWNAPGPEAARMPVEWFRHTGLPLLSRCGLWAMLAGLALAWGGMLFRFSPWGGGMGEDAPRIWAGMLVYSCVAFGLAGALAWLSRRVRPGWFLAICLTLELTGHASLVLLANPAWHPTNDAAIFSRFLDHLAENGTGRESLSALSDQYDYKVWTRRAHPFFLPLRRAAGDAFPRVVSWLQVLLSALTTACVWRTIRVVFGCKAACWAVICRLLFPFNWIACLELNHHLFGGFFFTAAIWVLVEFFRVPHGRMARLGLCGVMCLLLPLMKFEGGVDWVFNVAIWTVVSGLFASGCLKSKSAVLALAGLWLLPWLTARLWVSPVTSRIDAADLHHLESGAVAFMARGWVPETGGEYAYSHEIIDTLAPRPLKGDVQKRLLLSQLAYNGPTVFFRLFPTKLAKYFLMGFASGAEEMLNANGARAWAMAAKGARIAFFFFFAPLALLGGAWWIVRAGSSLDWPFLAPCALLAAAYVCTGETSPRYSIYIQTVLFAVAGLGATRIRTGRFFPVSWHRHILPSGGALSLVYLSLAALTVFVLAPRLTAQACLDARGWPGENVVFVRPAAPAQAPFAVELTPRAETGGTAWGPLALPADPAGRPDLLVFALPARDGIPLQRRDAELTLDTGEGSVPSQSLRFPACVRLPGAGISGGVVELHAPFACQSSILFGYAFGTGSAEYADMDAVAGKEGHAD